MDASKVGLGAGLLAASGLTLRAAGYPGAAVPLGLAGLAAAGLVVSALATRRSRRPAR